jgi:L-lactate dehydrogenase complex protein LldG
MTSRAEFLARITTALRGPTRTSPTPPVLEDTARTTRSSDDLLSTFAARAAAVGMTVHRTQLAKAGSLVLSILNTLNAKRITLDPLPDTLAPLAAALRDFGHSPPNAGFLAQYASDAGITAVHAAIAETGSLICSSGRGHSRATSLVPPVHIALVRRTDLVPDLLDYFSEPGPLPANTVLITGPSKTADIEGILINGVHGPRQVHIVLIEDA